MFLIFRGRGGGGGCPVDLLEGESGEWEYTVIYRGFQHIGEHQHEGNQHIELCKGCCPPCNRTMGNRATCNILRICIIVF